MSGSGIEKAAEGFLNEIHAERSRLEGEIKEVSGQLEALRVRVNELDDLEAGLRALRGERTKAAHPRKGASGPSLETRQRATARRQEILRLMKASDKEWWTIGELRSATGESDQKIRNALSAMSGNELMKEERPADSGKGNQVRVFFKVVR